MDCWVLWRILTDNKVDMAVAKFKMKIFDDPKALADFVATDSSVASVVSITTDLNNKYVLFYLTP